MKMLGRSCWRRKETILDEYRAPCEFVGDQTPTPLQSSIALQPFLNDRQARKVMSAMITMAPLPLRSSWVVEEKTFDSSWITPYLFWFDKLRRASEIHATRVPISWIPKDRVKCILYDLLVPEHFVLKKYCTLVVTLSVGRFTSPSPPPSFKLGV